MENSRICPNCQASNAGENLFCQSCGTRIATSDSISQSSTPPQPVPAPQPTYPASQAPSPSQSQVSYPSQPQQAQTGTLFKATRIDKLGNWRDGWAAIVEGAANKAEDVMKAFNEDIVNRQMPQVGNSFETVTPGGLAGKRRVYHLNRSYTGATTAVYIGGFGTDLYVAWDLFVRPVIKWLYIAIMVGVSAILAVPLGFDSDSFTTWLFATIGWLILIVIIAMIAGRIMRGNLLAFFIEDIDHFAFDDVTAMTLIVHQSLHKAIDAAGFDSSLLRPKGKFSGGRRGRLL